MLRLEGLHKTYGNVRALDGCSFAVARGRMLGFLGPNGAGKTTAMRAVLGLLRLDQGTITWDDRPIDPDMRLRFGYMPEQRGLYPKMRCLDQLAYFGRLHGMDTALARQAAEGWLERFGLTDRATERVERLSHGSQQRVQLAAALLHDPELLVLDEPFSGLDPLGVETMAGVLREKARAGAAVVFSSHQLDLVEDICEDVAIIHQGQVVLTGPLEQLRQGSPIRHLEIELEAGADQMLAAVEGVVASSTTGNRHRLVVKSDLDVKSLLARLDSAGPVLHFAYTGPSLTELFREAVT